MFAIYDQDVPQPTLWEIKFEDNDKEFVVMETTNPSTKILHISSNPETKKETQYCRWQQQIYQYSHKLKMTSEDIGLLKRRTKVSKKSIKHNTQVRTATTKKFEQNRILRMSLQISMSGET